MTLCFFNFLYKHVNTCRIGRMMGWEREGGGGWIQFLNRDIIENIHFFEERFDPALAFYRCYSKKKSNLNNHSQKKNGYNVKDILFRSIAWMKNVYKDCREMLLDLRLIQNTCKTTCSKIKLCIKLSNISVNYCVTDIIINTICTARKILNWKYMTFINV